MRTRLLALALVARAGGLSFVPEEVSLWRSLPIALVDHMSCKLCSITRLAGTISDCHCEFAVVDEATVGFFGPKLRALVSTPFFRYFKVDLDGECPFWRDDSATCALRACAVDECAPDEVPDPFLAEDCASSAGGDVRAAEVNLTRARAELAAGRARALGALDRSSAVLGAGGLSAWSERGGAEVWITQPADDDGLGLAYINLLQNPERFTGYAGASAHRVWRAVYDENCFGLDGAAAGGDTCLEKRVFFRLMSGLQSSISTHIAREYYDERRGWHENVPLFVERVGTHPERLDAMYFTTLFVLRALAKAAPALRSYDFATGDAAEDARTRALVRELVESEPPAPLCAGAADDDGIDAGARRDGLDRAADGDPARARAAPACRRGFDESALFQVTEKDLRASSMPLHDAQLQAKLTEFELELARRDKEILRAEFLSNFRNVSRIMDCVGCEKCRLWGKLQLLGIGTALKILITADDEDIGHLQRNEVIALVNTLAQLVKSVEAVVAWREAELRRALAVLAAKALGALALAVVACFPKSIAARLARRRARAV